MDRIKQICGYLEPCGSFADVACDHGYCAEYMLKNKLCKSAVISDISAKSLEKAQTLLSDYIKSGVCRAVCCDGLEKISENVDQVLISGIGGEEIIKILNNSFVPESFVLQPMKNAKQLRAYLLSRGCEITRDDIFSDGRNFYFIIKGQSLGGEKEYSKAELEFGRDSLSNAVLKQYINCELEKKYGYLKRELSERSLSDVQKSITFLKGVLSGEIK